MKRDQLKNLIKPIIKECIHEVIIESGVLSNIVAEVAKGMGSVLVESPQVQAAPPPQVNNYQAPPPQKDRLKEHRSQLTDAIGNSAYENIFEGMSPMIAEKAPNEQASALSGVDANDPGVDISGILAMGGNRWKSHTKANKG